MLPKRTAAARAKAAPAEALPTREAILDAAELLFAERGVDGVAVRDLARELGLTPSSLYNHFPGKQALYEAVLERGLEPLAALFGSGEPGEITPESVRRVVDDADWDAREVPHLAIGLFAIVFAFFVNVPALRRMKGRRGEGYPVTALENQKRFLEKAIYRLVGTRQAAGASR